MDDKKVFLVPVVIDATSECGASVPEKMAYQLSYVYIGRKEDAQALAWLQQAFEDRDLGLLSIKGDPMLRRVENAPEFVRLIHNLGLPE